MINRHVQYKVRVKVCFVPGGGVCCDTLLSDTVVLTPTFAKARLTILRISLFSGFHFVPSHTTLVCTALYKVLTSGSTNHVVSLSDTASS